MPGGTATGTAQILIEGNPRRLSLTVTNLDSTNKLYLKPIVNSQAVLTAGNADYTIGPGLTGGFTIQGDGQSVTQSPFQVLASAATVAFSWGEGRV